MSDSANCEMFKPSLKAGLQRRACPELRPAAVAYPFNNELVFGSSEKEIYTPTCSKVGAK